MQFHSRTHRRIRHLELNERADSDASADDSAPAWIVVGRDDVDAIAVMLDADAVERHRERVPHQAFVAWVAEHEASAPRWVWNDTAAWYPPLLDAGVRVTRCHDLRLSRAILRDAVPSEQWSAAAAWNAGPSVAAREHTLFEWETDGLPADVAAALDELARQRSASTTPALRLLLAAESAGALIAAELHAAGLPWDAALHERMLVDVLGERPVGGGLPSRIAELATRVRSELGDPALSIDSQPRLLRALHRVGVLVESTSKWELEEQRHPVVAPLLEYKRLYRLYTANGWGWLAEWVANGRFRPVYVPGGVVTGRWASSGGGALQIPRQLRSAVRADPGWVLVIADVAQLEPRVLASMARDERMAEAARGADLYEGIVSSGAVETRQDAKLAILGAMYGATTGQSGRLVPRLRQIFPRAMRMVDDAARTGEQGGLVRTWLGRTSPGTGDDWDAAQRAASDADATSGDEDRARRWARDRGRFTRNFIVQGTAAEWALAWLADLRLRLWEMGEYPVSPAVSGPVFERRPHLAFFLHDEVILHVPEALAADAVAAVEAAADAAGRLLFGSFPVDFRLDVKVSRNAVKD